MYIKTITNSTNIYISPHSAPLVDGLNSVTWYCESSSSYGKMRKSLDRDKQKKIGFFGMAAMPLLCRDVVFYLNIIP